MGLTINSTGLNSVDTGFFIKKQPGQKVIALAGNPNVGKSTVFNELTGLRQHTGNWPGKTVANAQGLCEYKGEGFILVDLPGTYSLKAHSPEEEVARDFICYGNHDGVVVVCDATCLERSLNLALQTIEITSNVVVCVNLMDEAKKKGININLHKLQLLLGVPVVATSALKGNGLDKLMEKVSRIGKKKNKAAKIKYLKPIEDAINILTAEISDCNVSKRWQALRLLENIADVKNEKVLNILKDNNIKDEALKDIIISCIILTAEDICNQVVLYSNKSYNERDRKIDKILTGKLTGYPVMIMLLALVFWLTIVGANYPSELISSFLFGLEKYILTFLNFLHLPMFLSDMLVFGVYRVTSWVVSVMLPPMAIFFPLFTILEDLGYLPRIAFNLDNTFKKCCACGKQALTMCMGFGCNAAGIVGCRIIDAPRERLVAMITNCFVPCNGRFPTIIAIITMFFAFGNNLLSTAILTAVVLFGVFMTFFVSWLLSKTVLKGKPSAFAMELPPYRMPRIWRVIVNSVFDRTIFVLGRALAFAAPAGLVIWLFANVYIGDISVLKYCADFLDGFAYYLGLDGVILLAFILGLPANEIVVPIILMAYLSQGTLVQYENLNSLKTILVDNGWTLTTAVCTILFTLIHWPCSTTLLTIKKETGSIKWTLVPLILPTVIGMIVCFVTAIVLRMF